MKHLYLSIVFALFFISISNYSSSLNYIDKDAARNQTEASAQYSETLNPQVCY